MNARRTARYSKLERLKHKTEGRIIQEQFAILKHIQRSNLPEDLKETLMQIVLYGIRK